MKVGGNYQGWLGHGWGISGFSVIERARPRGGLPAFDGDDRLVLDGTELVACAAGMTSPSCVTGGTHVAETESYQRFWYDSAINQWHVTTKDGVLSVFKPASAFANAAGVDGALAGYYRWLLAQVVDTHGNVVTYDYDCPELPVCFPKTISYSLYTVNFFLEDRPDHLLMANGKGISTTSKRIKSVSVVSNGAMVSVWSFAYAQSPWSNTSRLASIKRYGSDTVIDQSGAISTGTALPPVTFAYRNMNWAYQSTSVTLAGGACDYAYNRTLKYYQPSFHDVDNNGFDELLAYCNQETFIPRIGHDGIDKLRSERHLTLETINLTTFVSSQKRLLTNTYTTNLNVSTIGTVSTEKSLHWGQYFSGERKAINGADIVTTTRSNSNGILYDTGLGPSYTIQFDGTLQPSLIPCTTASRYYPECSKLVNTHVPTLPSNEYLVPNIISAPDQAGLQHLYKSPYKFIGSGNFFGDGTVQTLHASQPTAAMWMMQGWLPGAAQTTVATGPLPLATSYLGNGWQVADINGDGVSDIVSLSGPGTGSGSQYTIYLGNGRGFTLLAGAGGTPYVSIAVPKNGSQLLDMDGDGKDEFFIRAGSLDQPLPAMQSAFVNFSASGATTTLGTNLSIPLTGGLAGDINGDGLPDFLASDMTATARTFLVSNASQGRPNSLLSIKDELGGTNSFRFNPSAAWQNTFLPYVIDTLTEITADDGRGNVSVQHVSYSGGKFDQALRRFLGFRTVTETLPCAANDAACPTVETTYRQDVASAGAVDRVVRKDGAGAIHSDTVETWAVNASTKPYTARNIATTTTVSEGDGSATLKTERTFDSYGNVVLTKDYGRIDVTGDELMVSAPVVANTSAYIVDRPSSISKWPVFDSAQPRISLQRFAYDAGVFGQAPTAGDVTRQQDYQAISPASIYTDLTFTYDSFGNQTSVTDANGNTTVTLYDAAFQLFPVIVRDPLYSTDSRHQATATYNWVCAMPSEKTGIDAVRYTYTYDAFCRPYNENNTVTGDYKYTRYSSVGSPTSQNVAIYWPTPAGQVNSVSHFDGLGRTWRERSPGSVLNDVASMTYVLTDYDERGNITAKSLPHLTGDTAPKFVTSTYDWAGRPLRVTQADGAARTFFYAIWPTVAGFEDVPLSLVSETDELGRPRNTWSSTNGNVIRIDRKLGAGVQTETRAYDALGRMTGVRDADGAVWTNVYDMLGNRLSATDPDLGTWTYTYDRANRLTMQTDARGVKTVMAYDDADRLTERRIALPVVANPVLVTNIYDQAAAGYFNVGKLTSAANANVTQKFSYTGGGVLARQDVIDASGTHTIASAFYGGKTLLYKTYTPGPLSAGTYAAPWTYDGANRLKSIPGMITAQTYEPDGQTASITYANSVTTNFTYSPTRLWVTRITTKDVSGITIIDDVYTRDATGRIVAVNGLFSNDDWTYSYDDLDRLKTVANASDAARSETFTYAANDNMLSRSRNPGGAFASGGAAPFAYVYPAGTAARPHAPTSVAGRAFSYDGISCPALKRQAAGGDPVATC